MDRRRGARQFAVNGSTRCAARTTPRITSLLTKWTAPPLFDGLPKALNPVTVKLKLQAQAGAPLGPFSIPMTLRYQACNDSTCLPPVKLPLEGKIVVGSADAKAQASHPEIFGR